MRCTKYNIGDNRPKYLEKDGLMTPCVTKNFEKLGILIRIDATPEDNHIIIDSHGELINGQWIEVIDKQQTQLEINTEAKLNRKIFNFREIMGACDTLDLRAKLNAIADNDEFKLHLIGAGGVVDLNDATTIEAMAVFTPAEIQSILIEI